MSLAVIRTAIEKVAAKLYTSNEMLKLYVQSRGNGLVTNGSGLLDNNTNFSEAVFNGADTAGGFGSFQTDRINHVLRTDEFIPLLSSSSYRWSFFAKTLVKNGSSQAYSVLSCYDADRLEILPHNLPFITFRAAEQAQAGARSLKVHAGDIAALRSALSSNSSVPLLYLLGGVYTNSKGYTYPVGSYSRIIYTGTQGSPSGVAPTAVQLSADGTLTGFSVGFNQTIPAGTVLAFSRSGGIYLYPVVAMSGQTVPEVWTAYSATIAGSSLRAGTAFVRPGWQFNRASSAGNVTAVSLINLREV